MSSGQHDLNGKLSRIVPGDAPLESGAPGHASPAFAQRETSVCGHAEAWGSPVPLKAGGQGYAEVGGSPSAASHSREKPNLSSERWIQKERLLAHLAGRREPFHRLLSLPMTLIVFVALASLFILHLRLSIVSGLSLAVGQNLWTDDLSGLNFHDSIWAWLRSRSEAQLIAPHTPIVAGIRLARLPRDWSNEPWALCSYSAWHFLWDAIGAGGMPSEVSSPAVCNNRNSSDALWLPWMLNQDTVEASLAATHAGWYGPYRPGGGLQVMLLAHNAASNFYVLSGLTVKLDPSGLPMNHTILAAFDAEPVWLSVTDDWNKGRWPLLILDSCLLGLVCVLLVLRVVGLLRACCVGRCRSCKHVQFGIWGLVDWAIIFASFSLVVLYAYCCCLVRSLRDLVQALPVFSDQRRYTQAELDLAISSAASSTWHGYTQQLDVTLDQAQRLAGAHFQLSSCAAVLAACACLRLCRSLRANARVGTFVSTLQASYELVYPILASGVFLTACVLTGHTIYGSRIEAFSSLGATFGSTLLFLMGHSFVPAYKRMHDVGGSLGIAWVWFLGVMGSLLLLSWTLVVVMDAYIGTRAGAGEAPSLAQQARRVLTPGRSQAQELRALADEARPGGGPDAERAARRRAIREAVSEFGDRQVLKRLSAPGVHPASLVTRSSLAHALGAETWAAQLQLGKVLDSAVKQERSSRADEVSSLNHAIRLMARIDANVHELDSNIKPAASYMEMAEGREMGANMVAACKEEDAPAESVHGSCGTAQMDATLQESFWNEVASGAGSTAPSCTDDFECEDLELPPSPPPEEEDDPVALMWTTDLQDLLAAASAEAHTATESAVLEATLSSSRTASPPAGNVGVQELVLPPSPPPAAQVGMQPMAARLEALEVSGQRRWGDLREYCANLECHLASAAERMEATVGFQVEALSKLESTFDQLIHGIAPLFTSS
mmetsp:Transcript_105346/g.307964  ORF Transcript_105346/g.307964 Transcript_105346/m.307964 type:complete len:947 (+) Transcript_105346:140-2980(+)